MACVISILVWVAASVLVGGLLTVLQMLLTVLRPGIVGVIAATIGGLAGVASAEQVCDRWPGKYSGKAVFLAFCCFFSVDIFAEIFYVPAHLAQIAAAFQIGASLLAAYSTFWKRAQSNG